MKLASKSKGTTKQAESSPTPALATPVRRIVRKTSTQMEDVLFLGESKSKEKLELDEVLKKIRDLELATTS